MEGVTILNTIYKYGSLINPIWFFIFLVASGIIAVIGVCTIRCNIMQIIAIILVTVALIGTLICFIGMMITTDEIIDTKYQVIISEDVSFSEFSEKYEVVEQNGKIYTVREK